LINVNILLDYKKCEGSKCGACACACPTNVFTLEEGSVSIKSPEYCKLCGNCLEICPYGAINIVEIDGNF
jgi:NAD-dependent dihydropyrimidine dehydrogenase PreA subunit